MKQLVLNHQTRLAVNIIIEDETGMLTFSILLVTELFSLLWHSIQYISGIRHELSMLIGDINTALAFTGKVLQIGLSSLAYGVGVRI
ncbi:hypothetical protein ACFLXQ_04700 [Chloroflexota bacterium]